MKRSSEIKEQTKKCIYQSIKFFRNAQPLWAKLTFIIGVALIYVLFIHCELVEDTEQQITFIIASFAVLFSIVQFWLDAIRSKRDFANTIRYEEYKKARELVNEFIKAVVDIDIEYGHIELLSAKLTNTKNELVAIIQTSNDSIFKGILNDERVKEFGVTTDKILSITRTFRNAVEGLHPIRDSRKFESNWITWKLNVSKYNRSLHSSKYGIFNFMENKIGIRE